MYSQVIHYLLESDGVESVLDGLWLFLPTLGENQTCTASAQEILILKYIQFSLMQVNSPSPIEVCLVKCTVI